MGAGSGCIGGAGHCRRGPLGWALRRPLPSARRLLLLHWFNINSDAADGRQTAGEGAGFGGGVRRRGPGWGSGGVAVLIALPLGRAGASFLLLEKTNLHRLKASSTRHNLHLIPKMEF